MTVMPPAKKQNHMELWKPIPGYEGIYEASSDGRIRTCYGKTTSNARYSERVWKQRILKQKWTGKNRKDSRVSLWKDGHEHTHLVARLVASAFYGQEPNMTVNHIDGNPKNNSAENLEWLSRGDNIRHAFNTGLCDSFCVRTVLIEESSGESHTFRSMAAAGEWLGRSKGYISDSILKGREITSSQGVKYKCRTES